MRDIQLTLRERHAIIEEVCRILADRLYDETPVEELRLISRSRAAGLLDVDPKTLDALGLQRVVLSDGKCIKYLLSDVAKLIASRKEK